MRRSTVALRPRLGVATMIALVALRLAIGWHFFSEGMKHYTDQAWSSEGFLRSAKGPLAAKFQAVLPDFHGWDELVRSRIKDPDKGMSSKEWEDRVVREWKDYVDQLVSFYAFNDEQKADAQKAIANRQRQLHAWLDDNSEALETHFHEARRLERNRRDPAATDVPFQKRRLAEREAALRSETAGWLAQLKAMEHELHENLAVLVDKQQREKGPLPERASPLEKVDLTMTYVILGVGVCLLLGLFTRLASLAGAIFLLSVVLSQPFWIADTQPTYNQLVEMFALFALATTTVGRWGGLDFFIHYLLVRPCCGGERLKP